MQRDSICRLKLKQRLLGSIYIGEAISIHTCIEIPAAGESFVLIAAADWPGEVAGFEPAIHHGRAAHALEFSLANGMRQEPLSSDLKRLAADLSGYVSHGDMERPERVARTLLDAVRQRRILAFHCHAWSVFDDSVDAEATRMLDLLARGPSGALGVSDVKFHVLSQTERFAVVLRIAAGGLPAAQREVFARLLGEEALGVAADVMYYWSISPYAPTGSVAQLVARLAPGGMWGAAPYVQASLLQEAVALTRDARSVADLDRAGRHVGEVVGRMGVLPFAELLARLRRRVRPRLLIKPEALVRGPVRPAVRAAMPPAPPAPPPETEMAGVDEAALAAMLREAAKLHVPFCIPCMRDRLKNAA